MIFKQKISTVVLLLGTLFFALSLTPSLLPRPNLMQGLISGFALVFGYGIGVLAAGYGIFLSCRCRKMKLKKY